jgi:hypothetical protein
LFFFVQWRCVCWHFVLLLHLIKEGEEYGFFLIV